MSKNKTPEIFRRTGQYFPCQNCNKEFKAKTQWQKFCTNKCRRESFSEEDTWQGTCPKCNQHIVVMQKNNIAKKKRGEK